MKTREVIPTVTESSMTTEIVYRLLPNIRILMVTATPVDQVT